MTGSYQHCHPSHHDKCIFYGFENPLSVASQLHCVTLSGRYTIPFPAALFIAQARSRFSSVTVVAIQAQILNMNMRTADVQVLYAPEF